MPGCSLDENRTAKWTGSEINIEDAPCDECDGFYAHANDCKEDPIRRQAKWGISIPRQLCQICFAENGHRATCPSRAGNVCQKCEMYMNSAHTDRMCLIRQASLRLQREKEEGLPCEICTGVLTHHWPCRERTVIDVGKGD